MKLACAEKQMRQFIHKGRIPVIVLDVIQNALKPTKVDFFKRSTTAIFNRFSVCDPRLFWRDLYDVFHY